MVLQNRFEQWGDEDPRHATIEDAVQAIRRVQRDEAVIRTAAALERSAAAIELLARSLNKQKKTTK